jgi:hypothetical protein
MRNQLLLSLMLLAPGVMTAATLLPQAQPAAPAPAQPRTAAPRPPARTTMTITVTDPTGATLSGIHVEATGPAERQGDTDESGNLRFVNVRPGTYRVRFSGDNVITFEREAVARAGQVTDVDVMLNLAPAPPPQPPAPTPPAPAPAAAPKPVPPAVGPPGQARVVSILELLDSEFIGRTPRRDTALGCSGNAMARMIQLNDSLPERLYENAESLYYVLGGEGALRMNGRDLSLATGHFAMIPRGTSHAFTRRGRRPLILLSVLSGEPCETPTAP